MIIDFHTHAFPDELAEKAINILEEGCIIKARHNGTIYSLLKSMDNAGIDKSVICSIATKPAHFKPILEWSKNIKSGRIIPFLSIHPDDDNIAEKVKIVKEEGFKGIKLHPYYQSFILDSEKIFPLYEALQEHDLIVVSHTGFDIAFPKDRIADPDRILNIIKKFPDLKFITSHLGGWQDWDEVEKKLIGKNIFVEISFSLEELDHNKAKNMIINHPDDYILFGTDSPWTDQKNAVALLKSLNLNNELEKKIFYKNALKLLED